MRKLKQLIGRFIPSPSPVRPETEEQFLRAVGPDGISAELAAGTLKHYNDTRCAQHGRPVRVFVGGAALCERCCEDLRSKEEA